MAWRSEDLRQRLRRRVPARVYGRGEDYLARGRVLEWCQEGDELVGRVRGSYGHVYETRVWRHDGELEAACTCPYGDFCKHAVALVLAAAREEETARPGADFEVYGSADGPDRQLPPGGSGPQPSAPAEPAPAEPPAGKSPAPPASHTTASAGRAKQKGAAQAPAPSWEQLLSVAAEEFPRAEPERGVRYLVYRLYPHEQGLGLSLGVARYGVRGLGAETPFHFDPWYPYTVKWPPGATELDRWVLQLVQKRGYPAEYVIPAPLVGTALDLFFHLPFAFWGDATEPIAFGGPPLVARLSVEGTGDLRLRAVLYGPDGREWTPPDDAAYLLAGRLWVICQKRFFREVVAPCAPEVIFAALAWPFTVPAAEVDRFVGRYLPRLRAAGVLVPPPSLEARIRTGTPRPVLTLWEEKRALVGRLAFSYGEGSLPVAPAGDGDLAPLEVTREDGTHWIYRDVPAEGEALRRLAELGAPVGPDGAFVLTGEEALDFLWRLEEVAGEWEVYGLEKLRHYRLCRVRPRTRVRVSSGLDWFELELGLEWEGGRAGTEVVLPALRSGHRYVRLQDGRFLPLPPEWREAGPELVAELGTPEVSEGTLRLSKAQAPLAAAWLDTAAVREEDEDWRQFLHRLRHFGGVGAAPLPRGLKADLRPYQRHGYDWLCFLRDHGLHGVLADEMGLGKTVQVLALLLAEKEGGRAAAPSLVVVPTSLVWNWVDEARRFTPALRVLALVGPQRHRLFERLREYDLAVTTYGLLVRDGERLAGTDWHYLVLDEAHRIKNPASQAARAACRMRARHRLALTGTPLENNLSELWSLFHFLMPGLLGAYEQFAERYARPIEQHGDAARLAALRRRIHPFILRRAKEQVAADLPPRVETVVTCELLPAQRRLYEQVLEACRQRVFAAVEERGLGRSHLTVLDALLKLRQVCCHPQLLKMPGNQVRASAKLELFRELVADLTAEGHRILVFSQFVEMLQILARELARLGLRYEYLDGQTRDRRERIARFQESKDIPVFLMSLKAGGLGLNLTAANYVIHYDPWWNPAVEDQATDRAHRIGQEKPVFSYKLITRGTVEEKMLVLQERKKHLVADLLAGTTTAAKHLTLEDLQVLFSAE